MCDKDDDDEMLDLPPYGVLKHSNNGPTKMVAMFDDLRHADAYLDSYDRLDEDEFLTVQTPCQEHDGTMHILCTMRNKSMEIVEDDDGVLKAVPKEMAPMFGDKWVSKGGSK